MYLTVKRVQVRTLDRLDIGREYAERMEPADGDEHGPPGDEPTAAELPYYTHGGHRVFVTLVNPAGEHVSLDATPENLAVMATLEAPVNRDITDHGGTAETGWTFHDHAGCGMCPCSPGFLVEGTGDPRDVHVTATVRH